MPRLTPRLVAWGSIASLSVAVVVAAATSALTTQTFRHVSPTTRPASTTRGGGDDLFGLERDGTIEEVVPNDGAAETVARGAAPDDGIAEVPDRKAIFFTTGIQQGHCPSVTLLSLTDRSVAKPVVQDAELPSVSPDGSFLAFATTNEDCQEDGVGFVRIDAAGSPVGKLQGFLAREQPLPLPITAVTVSHDGAQIAFAGGLRDPVLGSHAPTVFVLHTSTATSLGSAHDLVDGDVGVFPSAGFRAKAESEIRQPRVHARWSPPRHQSDRPPCLLLRRRGSSGRDRPERRSTSRVLGAWTGRRRRVR